MSSNCKQRYLVDETIIRRICNQNNNNNSSCESYYDAVASVDMFEKETTNLEKYRYILALDRIRISRNVGLIVRSARALGFELIYLTHGTADIFSHGSFAASEGAVYGFPTIYGKAEDLLSICKQNQILTCVAHTTGDDPETIFVKNAKSKESYRGVCCILGNETFGPSSIFLQSCQKVSLPMVDLMIGSLNVHVASVLLMHRLRLCFF